MPINIKQCNYYAKQTICLLFYYIYCALKRRLLLDLQKYGGYSMAFLSLCIFCLLYAMMDQDGSSEQKP